MAMNKIRTVFLAAVTLCVTGVSAPVFADDTGISGLYLGVRAVGSVAEMEETTFVGFANSIINNDDDLTAAAAAYIGYRFEEIPLRLDIEGGHRFRFDYDARNVNGAAVTGYENNVDTTYALVNLGWEIRHFGDLVPYLGASVGWARNNSEVERNNLAAGITGTENEVDNLALGAMVGVDWHFAESWGTGIGYRYINLGEVDTGPLAAGESFSSDDYVAHDVMLSLEFRY